MPGAHLADDRLDARALLVALAVDLLRAGQQRLDLAEVDEDVPPVAGLLDDAGDDLADAVDVLVVHHLALRLADPLQDDLLRGLRGDAAEVLGRHVLALDQVLGNLGPVELEIVVGEQRVVLLAGLLLEPLELVERALARLVEQPHLEVVGHLDREDAEVAAVVELDRGVARRARRLLVCGEQRVLERGDERAALDSLLALDLANGVNDLLAHRLVPSSIRLARTICVVRYVCRLRPFRICTDRSPAATTSPRARPVVGLQPHRSCPTARSKCARVRSGRSKPGEETSTQYLSRYGRSSSVTRSQSAWSTPSRMVDVDAEPLLARDLEREHLDARAGPISTRRADLALQLSLLLVLTRCHRKHRFTRQNRPYIKNGRDAPISKAEMWWQKGSREPCKSGRPEFRLSSTIVTGPSFTSSTLHPRAEDAGLDRDPERAQRGAEPLVERLGAARARAAAVKLGRFPFAVSASSVNWETTSAAPPVSSSERSNLPSSFSKMRSARDLLARAGSQRASSSPSATPSRTQRPAPIAPPGVDGRARDALDDRSHLGSTSLELQDARGVLLASPASSSSPACSGRSPRPSGPASRATRPSA